MVDGETQSRCKDVIVQTAVARVGVQWSGVGRKGGGQGKLPEGEMASEAFAVCGLALCWTRCSFASLSW